MPTVCDNPECGSLASTTRGSNFTTTPKRFHQPTVSVERMLRILDRPSDSPFVGLDQDRLDSFPFPRFILGGTQLLQFAVPLVQVFNGRGVGILNDHLVALDPGVRYRIQRTNQSILYDRES